MLGKWPIYSETETQKRGVLSQGRTGEIPICPLGTESREKVEGGFEKVET